MDCLVGHICSGHQLMSAFAFWPKAKRLRVTYPNPLLGRVGIPYYSSHRGLNGRRIQILRVAGHLRVNRIFYLRQSSPRLTDVLPRRCKFGCKFSFGCFLFLTAPRVYLPRSQWSSIGCGGRRFNDMLLSPLDLPIRLVIGFTSDLKVGSFCILL